MNPGNLPFLKQLSNHLKLQYGDDLHPLAVVFPNRRAGLFFRKYLSEGLSRPLWSPGIYSIEDMVLTVARQKIGGNHQLLLLLYRVYQELEKDNARDLDDFLNWAPVMLDDFNEIDLYLADPKEVFTYLSEARVISQWSPDGKQLSEFQQSYLKFYQSLEHYYNGFHVSLQKHHLASQGSAYRYVAEHLEELIPGLPWKKLIFAGFNALTLAEEKIIEKLIESGKAEIFWDCDEYYLNNSIQEAGKSLRKYKNSTDFGTMRWISNQYKTESKSIKILGIPQHIGQAKVAGQLLAEIPDEEWSETALVLGDENMLIPVLNSIPETVRDFNVTMGLPLRLTPLNRIFEALFQLHLKSAGLIQGKSKATRSFYFKDLLSLFRHPWLSALLDANHANSGYETTEKGSGLKQREEILLTKTFFSYDEVIGDVVKPSFLDTYPVGFLFDDFSNNPLTILNACQKLTAYLKDYFLQKQNAESNKGDKSQLELEYLYSYSLLFSQIRESWEESAIPVTLLSLYKLFRQSVQTIKLSFYGEPLKGLQLMGMLETRNLDFKNIIILHVNDDILPAGKSHNSFIPLDIKNHFQLPTYRERQAVFAYHFYRLLQRARSVHLLYNTEPGQIAGGEKSRFIHQLLRELPVYNPQIRIKEEILSFPPVQEKLIQPIVIQKDDLILDKIRKKNISCWSATTLNQYRICSLQFYFAQIEGIEKPDEAEESMDAATLGTAFHETLENLFKPFVGKLLSPEAYAAMIKELPSIIPGIFKKKVEHGDVEYGKNHLLLKVAESVIGKYLQKEMEEAVKDKIAGREYKLDSIERWMTVMLGEYKLSGKADRIDQSGSFYRILDYKSGKITDNDINLSDINKLEDGPASDKIFQLLFYTYLFYNQLHYPPAGILPGIVSMRRPERGFIPLRLPKNADLLKEGIESFKDLVIKLLNNLYDSNVPFTQTEDINICIYCPYNPICIR